MDTKSGEMISHSRDNDQDLHMPLFGFHTLLADLYRPASKATKKLHANVRQEGLPTIDETADKLLRELRGSPTDLAKLVERIHQRRRRVVAISAGAITRWNKDDPKSWERVREWLTRRGVQIIVG
jgi:hypothetical protein